jgi:multidrug efflux pump
MERRIKRFLDVVQQDPAVEYVTGFTGGGQANAANMFMSLKPMAERKVSATRSSTACAKSSDEPGAPVHDDPERCASAGARACPPTSTRCRPTIRPSCACGSRASARCCPPAELTDVNSDVQDNGMQTKLVIDRDQATRLG